MKLPPVALTAPTLCPRCDAPAIMTDHCVQCALQLRQCGRCRGVAGPFDRFCGFCGHELLQGERRHPAWRLWLLLLLVPLAAGVGYGAWSARAALSRMASPPPVASASRPAPSAAPTMVYRSQALALQYSIPRDWSAIDYTRADDPGRAMPFVGVVRSPPDQRRLAESRGDLLAARPQSAALTLGRPSIDASLAADPTDPLALLTAQVAPLLAAPPPGTRVEVASPVRALGIRDRRAASVVLKLSRDGGVAYLQRALIYSPQPGLSAVIRVEATAPGPEWEGGDGARIQAVLESLRSG